MKRARYRRGPASGGGPVVQIPTITSADLGSNLRGGGPTAVVHTGDKVVAGLLANTIWSFGGTKGPGGDSYNTSLFEPFVDHNFGRGFSNFCGEHSPLTELCGVRAETCPPGFKTGDQIGPPGGYVGGGLQPVTDLAIGPAGDVWLMNNWQDIDSCFGDPDEALSTRCGGQGVVVFYGMAKPVRAPQIGPAQPVE